MVATGRRVPVLRGEVWLAGFDPTVGSEIRKTRPCVVISPPEINAYLVMVVVAPMTSGSHPAPFRIPVRFREKDGLILLDQMRSIDRRRFVRRLGTVEPGTLRTTLARLRALFAE